MTDRPAISPVHVEDVPTTGFWEPNGGQGLATAT